MALAHIGLPAERRQFNREPAQVLRSLTAPRLSEPQRVHDPQLPVSGTSQDLPARKDPSPKLEIRASSAAARGLGLFACEFIPAFKQILEDDALLSLANGEDLPQLWERYQALPPELKQEFDALSFSERQALKEPTLIEKLGQRGYSSDEAKRMTRVSCRFEANSFKTESKRASFRTETHSGFARSKWAYALFPTVARINHSCAPNAHAHSQPKSGSQVVYSLRDINPGDEIEIAYFDLTMPVNDRQLRAQSWGFQCTCRACVGAHDFDARQYEKDLSKVHRSLMAASLEDTTPHDLVHAAFRDITAAIDNVALSPDYPWLVATLPTLYLYQALLLDKTERPEYDMIDTLWKSYEWEFRITGKESPASTEKRDIFQQFFVTPRG